MMRGLAAGAAYGLLLLAAGTLLGTLRVPVAAPRLGAGRLGASFAVAPEPAPRRAMSAAALLLLLAGEAALAALLTGIRPAAWLAGFAHPASWPGLAAQLAACLMPLVRRRVH